MTAPVLVIEMELREFTLLCDMGKVLGMTVDQVARGQLRTCLEPILRNRRAGAGLRRVARGRHGDRR